MMELLDNSPYDFIINSSDKDIHKLSIKRRIEAIIIIKYLSKTKINNLTYKSFKLEKHL